MRRWEVSHIVDSEQPPDTSMFPTPLVVHSFKVTEVKEPTVSFELPLRLASIANVHMHWRVRQKRAKDHRSIVRLRTGAALVAIGCHGSAVRRVRITRLAPRRLDSDNAVIACKEVRDSVAQALGVDDRSDAVEWLVAQEKASGYGVRVELWA